MYSKIILRQKHDFFCCLSFLSIFVENREFFTSFTNSYPDTAFILSA